MIKLMIILGIVGAFLFCGWELFLYWDKINTEKEDDAKKAAAAVVVGESLPGVPFPLQSSLDKAEQGGAPALRAWLKAYDHAIEDPRKAWVQLDYVVMVSGNDVAEAKRIFAEVKQRTPTNSPVWGRVVKLEKSYE